MLLMVKHLLGIPILKKGLYISWGYALNMLNGRTTNINQLAQPLVEQKVIQCLRRSTVFCSYCANA